MLFHRSTVSDTEKGDEGRSERGWTKCEGSGVFRLVKRCVCTFFFFFFFLNFGLTRPIRTESARFWPRRRRFPPNRRRLQLHRPDSGLATWHDAVRHGTDARSAASLPRRTRVRRPWGRVRASQLLPLSQKPSNSWG